MADNYEMKIMRGQALNLAVAEAIAAGKADDPKLIATKFLKYFSLIEVLQKSHLDTIAAAIQTDDVIETLNKELEK